MKKDSEGLEILTKREVGDCLHIEEQVYNGKKRAWCKVYEGWCTAVVGADSCGIRQHEAEK